MLLHKLSIALLSAACMAMATAGAAKAETLTFDELGSPTPVDDLTVKGVTFDFKIDGVDSTDATYNQSFPPDFPPNLFANLEAPLLDGNARGILTLDFAQPTTALQFAVGVETFGPVTPALNVELFDTGLNSLGITPVDTNSQALLSEGLFTYNGVPVQRAVLDFNDSELGLDESLDPRFSLDNVSYTAVPEPSSFAGLVALGVLGGGLRCLRRKQQQKA